jgi:Spy/CpxP family protein refolding chaperone
MTHVILSQILSMMTLLVAPEASEAHGRRHAARADLCERIECTDDQKLRIDAVRDAHREGAADERAEAKRLREALKAERHKASPDADEIASLQASLDAIKTSMKRDREASKAEISAVLTAEQRERLAAMKAKHKAERRGKDKASAKRERGGKGKASAKRERGPEGKAKGELHAKQGRGPEGKAFAKRGRGGPKSLAKADLRAKRERGPKAKVEARDRG